MSKKRQVERQTTMQELAVNHPTLRDISRGASSDSLSTVDNSMEDGPFLVGVEYAATETDHATEPERQLPKHELDVVKYLTKREMTPFQERMNAITILPNPIYCLYFISAGLWVPSQQLLLDETIAPIDESLCLHWPLFPNFTALPSDSVRCLSRHCPTCTLFVPLSLHVCSQARQCEASPPLESPHGSQCNPCLLHTTILRHVRVVEVCHGKPTLQRRLHLSAIFAQSKLCCYLLMCN
jgi:hypothetical protein